MVGRFIVFASLLVGQMAHSETIFEGYYKLMLSGKHVGFYIVKHEFDNKKKEFQATTFMRIKGEKSEDTESVKAIADDGFHPKAYQYTSSSGGTTKTIDATFSKGKMIGTISNNGKSEKINRVVDPNTSLSVFLLYTILRSPIGLKPKTNFEYKAIAEEKGMEEKGTIDVKDFENLEGLKVLRIINNFVGTEANCLVSEKGEIISIAQPAQRIALELVSQPSSATGDMKVPTGILKSLFGEVPTGQKNAFADLKREDKPSPAVTTIPDGATKQQGVPGGKGIQMKVNKGEAKTETKGQPENK